MPIYEYICERCNSLFEELVMKNKRVKCSHCGASEVSRKMSVCGFVSSSKFVGSTGGSCSGCSSHSCSGCTSSN